MTHRWHYGFKLDKILHEIHMLREEHKKIMTQMDDLNAAISSLVSDVQAQVAATQALIDKITAAGVEADLTDEIQAVKDASAALEKSTTDAEGIATAPVSPPEPAPDEPPAEPAE